MDKDRALELLRQYISESPHTNEEYVLWCAKVLDVLKEAFTEDSDEYKRFEHTFYGLVVEWNEKMPSHILAVKSILQKYEILGISDAPKTSEVQAPQDSTQMANFLFDKMKFHPKVIEVSESLFKTKHYAQAIEAAFKAVNSFVKEKTGLSLDGTRLMTTVFSKANPIIALNKLKTQSDKDEQEGFMHLFMGAMLGIRNPKAHGNVVMNDPYRTLEYLGFASLLMKRAEEGTENEHGKSR